MQKWIPVNRRLLEICAEAEGFDGQRLKHTSWKDWSADAKALLTVALGRENLVRRKFKVLCTEVDSIKQTIEDKDEQSKARQKRLPELLAILQEVRRRGMGKGVFIAHGRDLSRTDSASLLLRECGLDPVVLYKQPDGGKTVIEKFEDFADASFAIVLLTADDVGCLKEAAGAGGLQPRARQNAIFELGFFVGRLGRENVCVVADPNLEIPSDYRGVVIIEFDPADQWKHKLTQHLQQAGFELHR